MYLANRLTLSIKTETYGLLESVDAQMSKIKKKNYTIPIKFDIKDMDRIGNSFEKYTNSISKSSKNVYGNTNKIKDGFKNASKSANSLEKELLKIERRNISITKQINDVNNRFNVLKKAPTDVASSVSRLNEKMVELGKITDSSKHSVHFERMKNEIISTNLELSKLIQKQKELESVNYWKSKGLNQLERFKNFNKDNPFVSKNLFLKEKYKVANDLFEDMSINRNFSPENVKALSGAISELNKESERLGISGKSALQTVGHNLGKFAQWLTLTTGITLAMRSVYQMFQVIKDVDEAMVNLKKVTDETDETYKSFLRDASKDAKALGITISDLVEGTATFAKLGYSLKEAQTLGKVASVYSNVGDLDINTANEHLVSVLKAFKIEGKDAIKVVDKLNELGNKYAVSSAGLGESLKRSSVAMKTANNTLDETLALLVGANEIVQNPEVVGTAFKTIAMRIRGISGLTKKEIEELGEDAEGMAEDMTKVQGKLLELTNNKVDIMLDKDTFKSTYQILKEVKEVWDSLTDKNQAGILELLAGKRQGQVIGATLENFNAVEKALKDSLNSQGSAMKEHEKWMEGIEGKTNRLKASFQELSLVTINSDGYKFIIDSLNTILNLITELGGAVPVLTVLLSGFFANMSKGAVFSSLSSNIPLLVTLQSLFGQLFTTVGFTEGAVLSLSSTFAVMLPVAGIVLAIGLMSKLHKTTDEYLSSIQDVKNERDNYGEEIDSLNEKLYTTQEKIDSIKAKGKLSLTDEEEIVRLEKINERLQHQLEFQERLYKSKEREINAETDKAFSNANYDIIFSKNSQISGGRGGFSKVDILENTKMSIEKIKEIQNEIDSLFQKQETMDAGSFLFAQTTKQIQRLEEEYQKLNNTTEQQIDQMKELADSYINPNEEQQKTIDKVKELSEIFEKDIKFNFNSDDIENVNSYVEDITHNLSLLQSAQNEYNKSGKISDSTMGMLIEKYPELNGLIGDEGYLRDWLANKIEEETQKKSKAYNTQLEMSRSFYQALLKQNADWVNDMKNKYQIDLNNFTNLMQAKSAMIAKISSQLAFAELRKDNFRLTSTITNPDDFKKQIDSYKAEAKRITEQEFNKHTMFTGVGANFQSASAGSVGGGVSSPNTSKGTSKGGSGGKRGKGGSGKSTDKWKEEFQKLYEELKYNKDMDVIDEQTYHDKLDSLNQKYFANKSKYIKEYRQYNLEVYNLSKKLSKERIKDIEFEIDILSRDGNREKQVELYRQLIEEVDKLRAEGKARGLKDNDDYLQELLKQHYDYIDKIKKIREEETKIVIDADLKFFEEQSNKLIKEIDDKIDELQRGFDKDKESYDLRIKELQKQKSLLTKQKNEEDEIRKIEELRYRLEQARLKLKEAKEERVRMVFDKDKGWIYKNDPKAIRDAEKQVHDAEYNLQKALRDKDDKDNANNIDSQIKAIQEEKKERDKAHKAQIKALQDEKKQIQEALKIHKDEIKALYDKDREVQKVYERLNSQLGKSINNSRDFISMIERATKSLNDMPKDITINQKIVQHIEKTGNGNNSNNNPPSNSGNKNNNSNSGNKPNGIGSHKKEPPNNPYGIDNAKWNERVRVESKIAEYQKNGDKEALKRALEYKRKLKAIGGYYASGGVVDYTGIAMVHGSDSQSETIFNAKDSKKLYDLVHNNSNLSDLIANRISSQSSNIYSQSKTDSIKMTIGDIILQGVNETDALAKEIVTKLPNAVLQAIYKK